MNARFRARYGLLPVVIIGGLLGTGRPAAVAEELGLGRPGGDDDLVRSLLRHQREAANARQMVSQLGLTRRQARNLLPVIEKAAALYVQGHQRQADLLPEMIETYTDFARQDSLNQDFTPEVERATADLHHREIETHDWYGQGMVALEAQAAAVLTPAQRQFADDFRPGQTAFGWQNEFLERRRQARSNRNRGQHQKYDRLETAREELHELHKQRHPQPSRAGKLVLHPMAAELICTAAGTEPSQTITRAAGVYQNGTDRHPLATMMEQRAELRRLHSEISNWNLINGLHFSVDQIDQIVGPCDDAMLNVHLVRHNFKRGGSRQADGMMVRLEQAVENLMTPGQRLVLAEFNP